MRTPKTFGEFIKNKRILLGYGLREFCIRFGFDPGNLSRIERGAWPPTKLPSYAKKMSRALRLTKRERVQFDRLASVANGMIPKDILTDEELVKRLPAIFFGIKHRNVDRLIELLRRNP